jgi:hypothetical protein
MAPSPSTSRLISLLSLLLRDDHRAVVTATQGVLAQIEAQSRLLHRVAMARVAVLRQQRPDVLVVVDF